MPTSPPPPPAGLRQTFPADLLASLVVFMVALPLCIGIAQACGLPAEAGIVTGIVGGLLVGAVAGSPLQVSGPAAGLIVLVSDFITDVTEHHPEYNPFALLGLVILLAGGFQMLAGVLRLGQWFRAVSPAVVAGMLAGIGLTIIAKQFHVMVDDDSPAGVLEALATIPFAIEKGFIPEAGRTANHTAAAFIGVVTIVILVTWKLIQPRSLKTLPAAVLAVVVAVAINEFGRPVLDLIGIPHGPAVDEHGGIGVRRVSVSADLGSGLTPVFDHAPGWGLMASALVWKAVFAFALIASAETLLCAVAVDGMQTGPRTNFDRELKAQGLGNLVCGMLGALPMTGVIVRSSANVDAGAKTRLSAILHGLWLLLFVTTLPWLLSRIPLSALAAVLVYTGWKLLDLAGLARLWRQSRGEAAIFILTAGTIVAVDLLAGVGLGIVLSAVKVLWMISHLEIRREDAADGSAVHIHLDGSGTFVRLPHLAESLDAVPAGKEVHVHLEKLRLVDHAVMTLLTTFHRQYESTGGQVYLNWDDLRDRFDTHKESRPPGPVQVVPTPDQPE